MKHRWMRVTAAAVATALAVVTAGCGTKDAAPSIAVGRITVFAAASLTESFALIGREFEADNPGSKVTFAFAGSSTLANQINQGAAADAFAAASPGTMKTVTDAGNGDGSPVVFARNQLVIAVPKGNPKKITSLTDLAKPGLKVAVCAEQVPCGAAAKTALTAGKVALKPVTFEQDVKAALSKLKLGDVDAALVYRTDVTSARSLVDGVEFPESASAINDYPVVAIKNAPNRAGAVAFLAYLRTDKARAILAGAGFQLPTA